jgi:hypothetical protein
MFRCFLVSVIVLMSLMLAGCGSNPTSPPTEGGEPTTSPEQPVKKPRLPPRRGQATVPQAPVQAGTQLECPPPYCLS